MRDDHLPDIETQRAMLQNSVAQTKQKAFALFMEREFVLAQGSDKDSRRAARKKADDVEEERSQLLLGLARLEEMLSELPEEEEGEKADEETPKKPLEAVP